MFNGMYREISVLVLFLEANPMSALNLKTIEWDFIENIFSDAKLKKQEERRMAKEEIKFVKKKGEKGFKKIFNDQDGEDFMKNTLGVQKKSMKKGGQVTWNIFKPLEIQYF